MKLGDVLEEIVILETRIRLLDQVIYCLGEESSSDHAITNLTIYPAEDVGWLLGRLEFEKATLRERLNMLKGLDIVEKRARKKGK
jgi:hypothetical protein